MTREDFFQCTPFEFYKAWESWNHHRVEAERAEWERIRVLAMFIAQPHSKRTLIAKEIMPLPWDDEPERPQEKEEISREEILRRYQATKDRYGLK